MRLAGKIATGVSVLVVGGLLAVAVPAVASMTDEVMSWAMFAPTERSAVTPSSRAAATSTSEGDPIGQEMIAELGDGYLYVGNGTAIPKGSPAGCETPAWIFTGGMSASVSGNLVDRGTRDLAAGTVGLDDNGAVVTYTVAPGDALLAIGERFCIANALAIANLNHTRVVQPGEVLLLRPDSSIPWVPYFNPDDAPAGYQQIPYQLAIEAMSRAAHADDLGAMREIFADDLSSLFPDPADAKVIADALEAGDLDVLRQMFA